MHSRLSAVIASSLLILLFGYTASSKIFNHAVFEATLDKTPFISQGAAVLSWLVPLSEIGIVLLLLFSKTRSKGLYASALLLGVFTLYLVVMLISGEKLPCSCGGVINGMGWWEHVAMNVGFIGLSVWGVRGVEN